MALVFCVYRTADGPIGTPGHPEDGIRIVAAAECDGEERSVVEVSKTAYGDAPILDPENPDDVALMHCLLDEYCEAAAAGLTK